MPEQANDREGVGADGPVFEGIVVPHIPPAALGLGLCDINKILTPREIAELDKDLADIVRAQQMRPEGWNTDLITG